MIKKTLNVTSSGERGVLGVLLSDLFKDFG